MNIIGQEKLLQELESYTLQTFPKTILLIGESGSGKHLIAKHVAKHLNLPAVDITSTISVEELTEYQQNPISTLYIINIAEFSINMQHKLLKTLEEPSDTMHIIILAESTVGVLPTILNRCTKFTCAPYSETQLKECEWMVRNPNDLVYKICKTPGQLSDIDGDQIQALFTLCDKVISQVKKASYANTLTLVTKINCDKDETKFDFYQFFNTLEYISFKKYLDTKDTELYKLYMYINKTKQSYLNKKIAKEAFMLNFLDGLWRLVH